MLEHGISAVAVLDFDGSLMDSVSASDLRGISTPEEFSKLGLPNSKFIAKQKVCTYLFRTPQFFFFVNSEWALLSKTYVCVLEPFYE